MSILPFALNRITVVDLKASPGRRGIAGPDPKIEFYANDTLAGILIIIFAIAVPGQAKVASENPPKWSYNPSSWNNRIPVIILAAIGFFAARYMSSFQLGHITSIWDPFFGTGTERVLTSEVARAFPISDAGLGATTYLIEGLSGLVGNARRWRTMPWMVFLFFILVVPAGVVSIVLIMLQPVVVGAWCWLCLVTAFATLISIPPAVDEVFASFQFLRHCRAEKKSLWRTFWLGDQSDNYRSKTESRAGLLAGIDFTWPLLISSVVGVGVVFLPVIFGLPKNLANSDYITGALVVTFAVLAFAEPIRSVRLFNTAFGVWIAASALIFRPTSAAALAVHLLLAVVVIGLSISKGTIKESYGGWERYIV